MRFAIFATLLFVALPLAAQFRFTPVNIAGATDTEVRGVNNSGEIVGFYHLASDACVPEAPGNLQV